MSDNPPNPDHAINEFLDVFFQGGQTPEDWVTLYATLVEEDNAADPDGLALRKLDDINELMAEVARELAAQPQADHTSTIGPDAIPMDAAEVQATADEVMPELAAEMTAHNATARQKRIEAIEKAQEAGQAANEAITALVAAARATAKETIHEFHAWCMNAYVACLEIYQALNDAVRDHPLGLLILTVLVKLII